VIDEQKQIPEGGNYTWRIPPGTYSLRVVASPDGAKVKWVGASCKGSGREVKEFNEDCLVRQDSQLIVENPGKWGVGSDINAIVLLTLE
jgi:hypothetical protein